MVTKGWRQQRISDLIRQRTIHNQNELQQLLDGAGITVTQGTLSRDLQELGVVKGADGYRLLPDPISANGDAYSLRRTIRRELRDIDYSGNMVVISTEPGHANALAVEVDGANLPEVLGTIAGDDTLVIIVHRTHRASRLAKRLRALAEKTEVIE